MDNSVYLLSRNIELIKCFLNCNGMNSVFELVELSTSMYNFDCKSLKNYKDLILVIDNIGDYHEHLRIVKQIQLIQNNNNIRLVFACNQIHPSVEKEIKKLAYAKIIKNPLNFIDFLNWIQNIDQFKVKKINMEKEISKHLNFFGIPFSVLGFTYLKEAVILKSKESKMKLVEICDTIARDHHTTSARVERCMRTALKSADQANFAYIGFKVTNISCKEFIVYLSQHLLCDHKE